VVRNDVQEAVGPLQACAGHEAGCEAAVHAMKEIISSDETEAVLLVDASNAFNTINRQAALHNIGIICPSLSRVLNNTYQAPVRLFVTGGAEIESSEGITQGDPLAMAMYALAVTPLIRKLRSHEPTVKQVWFADDSSGGGKIISLRRWWQCVLSVGPLMGYFPNPSKTHLVVKSEFEEEAIKVFEGTGIKVTSEGHEMLGSATGSRDFVKTFTAEKIDVFVNETENLAKIAEHYPQPAYAAFSHCIEGKWRYLMRTVEC
jgi:hypothetical protein